MANIIQILDVNSDGHRVRLDDGRCILVPHGHGEGLGIGDEEPALYKTTPEIGDEEPALYKTTPEPVAIAPSTDFLNSPEQVQANILSEIVQPHGESDASSEQSAAGSDGDSASRTVEAKTEK